MACKDFCPNCKKEMRKWIPSNGECVSMCITDGCCEQGEVKRALETAPKFKMTFKLPEETE